MIDTPFLPTGVTPDPLTALVILAICAFTVWTILRQPATDEHRTDRERELDLTADYPHPPDFY